MYKVTVAGVTQPWSSYEYALWDAKKRSEMDKFAWKIEWAPEK
jgi:hypothetical protein